MSWMRMVLATAVGTTLLLPGCLKVERDVEVFPDGSGRVEVSVAISPTLERLAKLGEEGDPTEQLKADSMLAGVRWEEPTTEVRDGWTYHRAVGYFADINAVKNDTTTHTFERLEDGRFRLVVTETPSPDEQAEEGQEEADLDDPIVKALVEQLFGDLLIRQRYTLPGKVTGLPAAPFVSRVEGEPRAAELKVTGKSLANDIQKLKELEEEFQGKPMEYVSERADEDALRARWEAAKDALERLEQQRREPAPAPAPQKPKQRVF